MKLLLFILIFILCKINSEGQSGLVNNIDFKKYKLILIGEPHYIIEKNAIELNLIRDIAKHSGKQIKIYLEYPASMTLFIDRFFKENDSLSLNHYFLISQKYSNDSINLKNRLLFKLISDIKKINNNVSNVKIECIDHESDIRTILFTLQTILKEYKSEDSLWYEYNKLVVSLIDKNNYSGDDLNLFKRQIISEFYTNKEVFRSIITNESDYNFISKIFDNYITINTCSEQRDIYLANNLVSNTNDSTLYIAILGNAHVNKYFNKKIDISGNRESIGFIINNVIDSPFKHSTYSISIMTSNIKTINATLNYDSKLYFLTESEKKKLTSINKNINFIVPLKKEFKYAYKSYNLIIYIKNSTSNLWDI